MGFINNVVVQILLGVGCMVFIIVLAEAIKSYVIRASSKRDSKEVKEIEARVRSEFQKEIAALRQDMDTLKGTLLEHSMSLQSNVDNLKHRLDRVNESGVQHNEIRP